MVSSLNFAILLGVLVPTIFTRGGMTLKSPLEYSSAESELQRICATLSESSIEQNLTLVFVIYVGPRLEIPLNYLWQLPRALIYLSEEDVILGDVEREIVISWERDPPDPGRWRTKYWDLEGTCGHRKNGCESNNRYYMTHFRLEKRILLQIREWSASEDLEELLALTQERIRGATWLGYFNRFRAIFTMIRMEKEDRLHSQITVRRTGDVIGKHVWKLRAEDFSLDHVRTVFLPSEIPLNRTDDFLLDLPEASFKDGKQKKKTIYFNSCHRANKAYVHAYDYLAVRLAVPLPWETQLISRLPQYMGLEIPLTALSLLALPILFTIRRHRTLHPTSSTWRMAYHLMSGDANNSLIDSAKQTTLVLLISGVVTLVLQYPISLLKGEVISSPYGQRIQASTCVTDSCWFESLRGRWYRAQPYEGPNFIGRLAGKKNLADSVRRSRLSEGCPPTSHSLSGMVNWTVLAFLTQYLTVCDDPALMKMQLAKLGKDLAFDLIPGSHNAQAICSTMRSDGGHVEPRKHYQMTRWILEHGLLKYLHVNSSLYTVNGFDLGFWNRPRWGNRADPSLIKPKVESSISALKAGYAKYKMLERGSESTAIKLEGLRVIFLAFLGATCSVLLGCLLRNNVYLIREHRFLAGKRVSTGSSWDERRVSADTVDLNGRRTAWVRDVGEVMIRRFSDDPDNVRASSSRRDSDSREVGSGENSAIDGDVAAGSESETGGDSSGPPDAPPGPSESAAAPNSGSWSESW